MLAQAEHDTDASAILDYRFRIAGTGRSNADRRAIRDLPTADVARSSIERNSAVILVPDLETGVRLANDFAPEHLSLHETSLLNKIRNAGTVFLGREFTGIGWRLCGWSKSRAANVRRSAAPRGISAADFVKVIAIQQLSPVALKELASAITTLARAEGLRGARPRRGGSFCLVIRQGPRNRGSLCHLEKRLRRWPPYHPPSSGRRNKLRLDFNENTVGASPLVLDFLKRFLTGRDLAVYPEYENALEDLAQHFAIGQDQLTLTNGTDEAIQLLVNTFVGEGQEVLILKPSYAMYKFYNQLAGANISEIDYRADTLAFPLEELIERVTPATRGIFISNPNNPTGTGTTAANLERILEAAPNAAVLVDEAYYEFCGVTVLPLIRQWPNLFVSRTFSKVYGMAAMRCGCLFSDRDNMAYIRKAQSPYSVNMLAAMAARIAVQDRKFVEDYVLEVLAAKELVYVGLERLGISYFMSQANFVLFQAGERASEIRDELRSRGVLIRDRSYEIPGCVRVTVGTREQMERFLKELKEMW